MKQFRKIAVASAVAAGLGLAVAAAYAHSGAAIGPHGAGGIGPGSMHGMGSPMMHGMGSPMMHGGFGGPMAAQQLITPEERQAFIEKMRGAKTAEERQKLAEANRAEIEKRAKEKGITLPEAHGPAAGSGPHFGPHSAPPPAAPTR